MEDLYILDGVEITYDQIVNDAREANMGFNEYVALKGIETKQPEVEEEKTQTEDKPNVEEEQDIVKIQDWQPTESNEYYESLPMMSKEYGYYQDWKESNAEKVAKQEAAQEGINLSTSDPSTTSKFETVTKPYLQKVQEQEDYELIEESSEIDFQKQYKPKNNYIEANLKILDEAPVEDVEGQFTVVDGFETKVVATGDASQDLYSANNDVKNYTAAKLFPDLYEVTTPRMNEEGKLIKKGSLTKGMLGGENVDAVLRPIQEADISRGGEKIRFNVNKEAKRNEKQEFDFIDGQLLNLKTTPEIIQFYQDPTKVVNFEELKKDFDKGRFTLDQKEIYDQYKSNGVISPEAAEKYNRKKLNLGEKLFDENGNLININYATDKEDGITEEESNQINAKAKQYQEKALTVDELKNQMARLYYELLYVDKKISSKKDEIQDFTTELTIPGILQSARDLLSGGRTLSDPLKATDAAINNELGLNAGKIAGNHPLVRHHNELIVELMALNQAIKLNSNLMTIKEEDGFRFAKKTAANIFLGGDVMSLTGPGDYYGLGSTEMAASTMKNIFTDAGLELDPTVMSQYDVNETTFVEGGLDAVSDIAPLLYAISGVKGAKVKLGKNTYGVKPSLNKLDAYTRLANRGKGIVRKKFNNVINGIAKETLTFAAAGEFMNGILEQEAPPLQDAFFFGVGNSAAAGVSKYFLTKSIPFLSKFARTDLGIGLSAVGQPVVGGVTATAVGKFAESGNLAISYFNGASDAEIQDAIHHLTDVNKMAYDVIAFTGLGVRGKTFTNARDRILAIRSRSQRTIDASKELGIKEFSTEEQISAARRKKLKEEGLFYGSKNLSNEQKSRIAEIDNAAKILRTQNAVKEAKDVISKDDKWWESSAAKLEAAANKMAMGEPLKIEDLEVIEKYGETVQKDGKVNTSLNIIDAKNFNAAAIVMYDRLQQLGVPNLPPIESFRKEVMAKGAEATTIYSMASGNTKQAKQIRKKLLSEYQKIQTESAELKELEAIVKNEESPTAEKILAAGNIKNLNESIKVRVEKYQELVDQGVKNNKDLIDKDIKFWKPIAEKLGIEFNVMDNADYVAKMTALGKSKTSEGLYADGKVYINKDRATKTGAVSVATHEMIHALLLRSFIDGNGKVTSESKKVLDSFYNSLSSDAKAEIDRRTKLYENPEEQKYNEYMTLFSDAARRGKIKFNEGFLNSMTDFIGKLPGVKNKGAIDLTSKEGIVDFLKILDKSYKKGDLDSRIYDFWETQKEKETSDLAFESESFDKKFDKEADINVTKEQWDAGGYDKAFKMVDRGTLDELIKKDVGKNKIPIRGEKIVIQDKEFTIAEFVEDVRSEVKTVIRNFNPEVNKSLFGWITNPKNLTNKRKVVFEAYEKIARGEKAARGEGKAEIQLVPERPAEPAGAGRTESMKLISATSRAELINNVKKQITDGGKYPLVPETMNAYLNTFKNKLKDIPNLAAKELAKEIGIAENKISNPKDNLSKPEAFKAQRWLMSNMNYAKAIDLMPFNNVPVFKEYAYKPGTTQKVRHPKSRKGENFIYLSVADAAMLNQPTGLFGNIKRDFFTKTDQRIGNDFLWTKNQFSEKYFLEKVGIKDRKKAETFTQRASEAQTLKGVLNYIAKDMTLKAMSEEAGRLGMQNEVNNLRSGKNVYAASESYISKLPEFVQNDFMFNRVSDIAREFKIIYNGSPKDAKEVKAVVDRIMKGQVAKGAEVEYVYSNKDTKAISDAIFRSIEQARNSPRMQESIKLQNEAAVRDVQEFINERLDFVVNNPEKVNEAFWKAKDLKKESMDPDRITTQRENSKAFFSDYISKAENKAEAISKLVSFGEQYFSASAIGGGRYQYFENIADFRKELNFVIKEAGLDFKITDKNTIVNSKNELIKKIPRYGKTQHKSDYANKQLKDAFGKDGNVDLNNRKAKQQVDGVMDFYENLAVESRKILDAQMEFFMREFKAGKIDNIDMALYTMTLKSGMGTILRMAAPLREIYNVLPGEKRQMKTSVNGEKVLIWEHSKAAEKFLYEMLDIYMKPENMTDGKLNESGKTKMQELYKNYYVTIMPYAFDTKITKLGYQVAEPTEGTRYHNKDTYGLKEARSTTNLITGEVKGEAWAEAAVNANNPKLAKENLKSDPIAFASESNTKTNAEFLEAAKNHDLALAKAKVKNKVAKKIRVFDFDDTLARSNNIVIATKEGKTIRLNAEEFAKRGLELKEDGWTMDFSDFNRVTDGSRGPLFEVAEKIKNARGNEDLFVLTARAPESRNAIYDFLKSQGLEFKIDNIIGLGNSTGEAKARWLVSKAAEGYNDFYFADDAVQNVKAVREALSVLDIKSKVQQAYASESEVKSIEFNRLLEQSTGIEYYKEYSAAKAKTVGANKGKFKFWIPYSAEDFQGLIYPTLAKGKLGDKQMAWYKTNLLNPYARAMDNLSRDRVQLMSDFKALKKQLNVPKDLRKTNSTGFTNEQAVRVYLYNKMGYEVPGLSKKDLRELLDVVSSDAKLQSFAEQILTLTKGDGYVEPNQNWLVGTITTDLVNLLNTTKRGKYLEEWRSNVDQIYSKENLNKLEAIYGPKYREALENILTRMKSGRNRLASGGRLSNQILDYINGSNAAIMFFNTRSAVLQTISSINFINWSFNNPIRAGAAFANQPQYWKDFTKLMNSDYLLDRRNGLRLNIAENEIADAAATSKNKVKGALRYILEKGYLPTQYADSFAIASGGATWYRNRINDLVKKGVEVKQAEKQALLEWRQVAEESQQSSDPSKISQQQASDAGRLILMFANTPMQYARLQKRAFQDLVNGRGDAKTNVSKIAYYAFVQNMIFNALQQAVFKLGFDDEDNDKEKEKTYFRTANGMIDSQLRGLGIAGAAISVAKNFLLDIYERSGRKRPEYVDSMWKLLQFSPPISSKISKLRQAAYAFDSKKRRQEIFDKGFSLDNPAAMAGAKVISATTNIPLDRVLQKIDNVQGALSEEADWWQTTAMLGGWPRWSIMPERDEYVTKSKEDKYKEAKGSNDFETLKALNKAQQEKMLKDLGYGTRAIKDAKTEADRIKLIQEVNKDN